ncbi:hypothetical protein [Sinorhizobium psoraleae]|uniref:Uncharacterized protein n=1 Tax=Sinorhizobium psoraleae TaxID=520838 RepID=A0ABT4KCZ7_9HYPH|nr:hypothetical protein [Sinorhizobium psoraleae]MCZ4088857.1 hypothetical protein [Sinorhizobium psoraleae]
MAEFVDIANNLSDFETSLRLHPSTKEATRAELQEAVGEQHALFLTTSPKINENDLREYDVVVTYYSTVFLDCIANNIPCVIYKTRSVDIELPRLSIHCSNIAPSQRSFPKRFVLQ